MDENDVAEVHIPLWKVSIIYGLAFLPVVLVLGIAIFNEAAH